MTNSAGARRPQGMLPEGQQEFVVARLRPQARRLFWSVLLLLLVSAALGFFGGTFPEAWQNVLLVLGSIAIIGLGCLVPFLIWLGRRYIITSRRLIIRHGLFTRVQQELLHSRGYDLTVRQGALQRMSRSGDVRINAGLDNPLVLKDVPSALLVAEALQDLMEANGNRIASRRQAEESRYQATSVLRPDDS